MLKNMQEVLEYGFDVLNKVYFNNELPPIVITIMSAPRSNGHFTCGKVWRAEEAYMHEINLSAEHLDVKGSWDDGEKPKRAEGPRTR